MRKSELYSLDELKEAWPDGIRKVIVVGSQMAGAGLAAKLLSKEFNLAYVNEKSIAYDDLEFFFRMNSLNTDYMLEAPGLTFICHRLPVDMVIFMRRNYHEIIQEEKKTNWRENWGKYEIDKYYQRAKSDPSLVKDRAWRYIQKRHLDYFDIPHFDLWYESLLIEKYEK